MLNFFKRRRPQHSTATTPAPMISREDVLVTLHWGYTPDEWAALSNEVRTAKRSGYFQAVGLGA